MNSTKVITGSSSSSSSPLSVKYGASDIVQDDIVLHSIVKNNSNTITQLTITELNNTLLKNNITRVSNITVFGTINNMGEQALLQDGLEMSELLINDSRLVNASSTYEIPVVETYPLLGFTFCLVSAIFIGFSFIFQRKANLINNDDEKRQSKHQTSPDQSHTENINDAYVDIDHELPIIISNLKTDQPTHQHTSKFDKFVSELKTKNYVFLQPVWWIGIGSLIVGEFFQIFAFKYATTTLIAPLGAMRVISTAMFSRWYLKERVSKTQLYGIAISMLGSLLLILCAPRVEEAKSVGDILLQASLVFNVFFVLLILYTSVVGVKLFQLNNAQTNSIAGSKTTNSVTLNESSSSTTDVQKTIALFSVLQTCTLGTISVLSTKLLTMLDLTSLSFVNIVVYFLLVTTCPMQIYYINIALKYEQASRVMPLKYAGGNILIMFGSVMLFHEWEFLTGIQVFGMVGGLVVAIGGIYMVVKD